MELFKRKSVFLWLLLSRLQKFIHNIYQRTLSTPFPLKSGKTGKAVSKSWPIGKKFSSVHELFILCRGDRESSWWVSFTCGGWRVVTFQAAVCKWFCCLYCSCTKYLCTEFLPKAFTCKFKERNQAPYKLTVTNLKNQAGKILSICTTVLDLRVVSIRIERKLLI